MNTILKIGKAANEPQSKVIKPTNTQSASNKIRYFIMIKVRLNILFSSLSCIRYYAISEKEKNTITTK